MTKDNDGTPDDYQDCLDVDVVTPKNKKLSAFLGIDMTPEESWEIHWKAQPKFAATKDNQPKFQVLVNFKNLEDLKKFEKLVEQTVTEKTKSIWWPNRKLYNGIRKWVSAEDVSE